MEKFEQYGFISCEFYSHSHIYINPGKKIFIGLNALLSDKKEYIISDYIDIKGIAKIYSDALVHDNTKSLCYGTENNILEYLRYKKLSKVRKIIGKFKKD